MEIRSDDLRVRSVHPTDAAWWCPIEPNYERCVGSVPTEYDQFVMTTTAGIEFMSTIPSAPPVLVRAADVVIGRGADADHAIDQETLSRRHARLVRRSHAWVLNDLESTNGTFVNLIRLEPGEPTPVRSGDVVGFGSAEFVVRTDADQVESARSPAPRPARSSKIDGDDFRTRGSLLLRLGADETCVRELSWQDFYAQYVPIIRGFARNAGCPSEALEDIVHEVMAGFYRASERFEYDADKGRFRGYLKRATLNALRTRHRKVGRFEGVDFDEAWLEDESDHGEVLWARAWQERMLERAMTYVREETRLSEQSLDAFELCALRGVPVAEAARQLDLSEAATQKAKNRVAGAVREELDRIRLEEG